MVKTKMLDELIKFCLNPRRYLYKKKLEKQLQDDPELLDKVLSGEQLQMPPGPIDKLVSVILWLGPRVTPLILFAVFFGFLAFFTHTILSTPFDGNVTLQNGTVLSGNQTLYGAATTISDAVNQSLPFGSSLLILILTIGFMYTTYKALTYGFNASTF